MAHFAEVDDTNTVLRVIVVNNSELLNSDGIEQESLGQSFCQSLFGGTWVQTSYNRSIRKNYAGVGYTYDSTRDAFIAPQPFASWFLDEATCNWLPPVDYPSDGQLYTWNEVTTSWDLL